ncbi:MAG: sulfatase-like hydrolase/transferase, partial [Burkholderiales bacterium]|nr:sulfatase-like hydrolase/transferase [Burkholderiales bacterium]
MKPALRVSLIRLCVFLLLGGITLAHFFVLRAADFVWNDSLFSAATKSDILSALAIGIRFDLSAWAYLLLVPTILLFIPLPPMWARRRFVVAGGVLIVTALPLLIMGWIDCELIRFTKARMTPATVFLFTEGEWQLKDFYHYIYLFIVAVIALTLWLVGIIKTVRWGGHKMNAENDLYHAFAPQFYRMVGLLPLLCVLVIGIRGGITHSKPIKPVDTFPELHLGNWALNTPFVFIKSMKSAKMVTPKYFDDHRQMMMLLNGADNNVSHIKAYRKENPQNIVILIMESLSLGYMGEVNHVKTYTPFLDQLAAQSLFFSNAYANANRSIDGIPAVLAALPALGAEPFLTSPYATASFEGLPATLSKHGYQSAFFHGAKRGSMFFDQFTKRAGFDVHFAREDYPNPAD